MSDERRSRENSEIQNGRHYLHILCKLGLHYRRYNITDSWCKLDIPMLNIKVSRRKYVILYIFIFLTDAVELIN